MTRESGAEARWVFHASRITHHDLRHLQQRVCHLAGRHGNADPIYDNTQNGLEAFLAEYLQGMHKSGLHEYNSRPYIGYTLRSLLNIASFADGPVKQEATKVLDRMNWDYALGSLSLRRFPPFRRQFAHSSKTDLDGEYHTSMMKGWMSVAGVDGLKIQHGQHHAMRGDAGRILQLHVVVSHLGGGLLHHRRPVQRLVQMRLDRKVQRRVDVSDVVWRGGGWGDAGRYGCHLGND